ncbi:hypothetical protein SASPL_151250 [Salvia splendens]|uniref:Expansin-like EG45 domain-containing protein n=1 Tax=Salvia splendens TaxID=180675 RepID=A0A8X8W919_SALSN|nr:hypothetical protein SASPL_151250 [Salvia splendens]
MLQQPAHSSTVLPRDGGACGLGYDIENDPYYGFISAGNNKLFQSGAGCGACYERLFKKSIRVTITDECPGSCNDDDIHFDLSGKAFGALAYPGQEYNLRNAGRISLQYRSLRPWLVCVCVQCHYNFKIAVKTNSVYNPYCLAMTVENVNGDGEIDRIESTYQLKDRNHGHICNAIGLRLGNFS